MKMLNSSLKQRAVNIFPGPSLSPPAALPGRVPVRTGDGYTISAALGHTIVKPKPALVPLIVHELKLAKSMQGVSLRNVRATAFQGKAVTVDAALTPHGDYGRGEKKIARPPLIESRFGEMLFTHFGLGGPIILLMSLAVVEALENGPVSILIDLKPALSKEQLRKRLQLDLNNFGKRKDREYSERISAGEND